MKRYRVSFKSVALPLQFSQILSIDVFVMALDKSTARKMATDQLVPFSCEFDYVVESY